MKSIHQGQCVHEQLESSYLVVVYFVWDVEFPKHLAKDLLVLLYQNSE